jgi:hypothetical protein
MSEGTVPVFRAIDDGEPLQLLEPPNGFDVAGFAVSTAACANPACTCTRMGLSIRVIRATPDGTARLQDPGLAGECSADGQHVVLDCPRSEPFPDEVVRWLESRLAEPLHQRWLAERWRRMRGQIGDPTYLSGIAPEQIEFLVPLCDVFPWDFDLTVVHDGRKLLALDTYCMNPSCGCDDVTVQFFDTIAVGGERPNLGHVKASLRRLRSPDVHGPAVLRQLWSALLDQLGADRLRDRFKRMRGVAARQAVQPGRMPSRNGPCPCGSGKKYKRCCGK